MKASFYVNQFIDRFHLSDNITEVFTSGCCYWFAVILSERFKDVWAKLMYDEVNNHFGTMIYDRVYDITGDVTDKYNWVTWDSFYDADMTHASRILRDCAMF